MKGAGVRRSGQEVQRPLGAQSDDVAAAGRAGGAQQPVLGAALDVHRDGLLTQGQLQHVVGQVPALHPA